MVGLGISQTNADFQTNPVYNAFHRFFCCANETIRQQFCKPDLDAANLRPALEQGLRKAMSAGKSFFRANLLHVPNVKMQRRLRSRSVHFLGTCEKRSAAQWGLPKRNVFRPQEKSEFGIAQRFSFRKYPKSVYQYYYRRRSIFTSTHTVFFFWREFFWRDFFSLLLGLGPVTKELQLPYGTKRNDGQTPKQREIIQASS